jgi:hypothetical protein
MTIRIPGIFSSQSFSVQLLNLLCLEPGPWYQHICHFIVRSFFFFVGSRIVRRIYVLWYGWVTYFFQQGYRGWWGSLEVADAGGDPLIDLRLVVLSWLKCYDFTNSLSRYITGIQIPRGFTHYYSLLLENIAAITRSLSRIFCHGYSDCITIPLLLEVLLLYTNSLSKRIFFCHNYSNSQIAQITIRKCWNYSITLL